MENKKHLKKQNIVFAAAFLLVLFIPLVTVNRENGGLSRDENRYLAKRAALVKDDGSLNEAFASDFENWINDNIGLRALLVKLNAGLQYRVFGNLSSAGTGSSDFYLGPKGEFNYAEKEMLLDYQHKNLYSQEQLDETAAAYQKIKDTLEARGIRYYYMQCRDKHSIYPEQFMTSVNQYGDESLVDQVMKSLKANTTVDVIDTTEVLKEGKTEGETFGRYTDPSHWTEFGAYLAYRELMEELNRGVGEALSYNNESTGNSGILFDVSGDVSHLNTGSVSEVSKQVKDNVVEPATKYKVLEPEDYDIELKDQGTTLYGGIHEKDEQSSYVIKNPGAVEDDLLITPLEGTGHRIFTCDKAGNDEVVLIIGDSYVENYILDDIAESFGKTIFVWGDYSDRFMEFIELYKPAIVINENAERCSYRFPMIVRMASEISA
ncbi:SGNH hydrolase-like domain-containing protein, acetyltransferase AlgX [Oribacterium sp. KHPX15]|uniref:alginate O-acetyltransferase AlgX-related protein n=1 Tax=Oribacterium sp. KHPX15 TaxID=1855342 RepID=UPI00089CD92B|nr:hypothetical protein [Oribacterium sp. KHPX15]SEA34704.1 SGNH hydrolase-like domain-containing protein, acetyltransferase AlgX [Oribacterium sp. KHPX15]